MPEIISEQTNGNDGTASSAILTETVSTTLITPFQNAFENIKKVPAMFRFYVM
jgi:hypothetical protein